jgi:hypothetical protein
MPVRRKVQSPVSHSVGFRVKITFTVFDAELLFGDDLVVKGFNSLMNKRIATYISMVWSGDPMAEQSVINSLYGEWSRRQEA